MAVDLRAFNLAFAQLLKNGATAAGTRVSFAKGPIPARGYPQITFDIIGESPWNGYTPGKDTRVALRCHDQYNIEICRKIYSQVYEIFQPASHAAYGYYGNVTVTVADIGTPTTVRFSGIAHNAGPNALEDPPTGTPMLESYWLVPHYAV